MPRVTRRRRLKPYGEPATTDLPGQALPEQVLPE
jgi:hypothetical protein